MLSFVTEQEMLRRGAGNHTLNVPYLGCLNGRASSLEVNVWLVAEQTPTHRRVKPVRVG
jgi:hypothetical protein